MTRFLAAALTALMLLALGACDNDGGGDSYESGGLTFAKPLEDEDADPEDIVRAWAEVVCEEEPVSRASEYEGVELSRTCIAESDRDEYNEAWLDIYTDPQDAQDYDSGNDASCDVGYAVISGARWVSYHDNSYKQDELMEASTGTLICDGE